jgi:hypothetical protein
MVACRGVGLFFMWEISDEKIFGMILVECSLALARA